MKVADKCFRNLTRRWLIRETQCLNLESSKGPKCFFQTQGQLRTQTGPKDLDNGNQDSSKVKACCGEVFQNIDLEVPLVKDSNKIKVTHVNVKTRRAPKKVSSKIAIASTELVSLEIYPFN